jgi:AcrR family transcriptional regulator
MDTAPRRPASLKGVNDALPPEPPAPATGHDTEPVGGRARTKTVKSEQTRALILETAMRLFQERGYDKTTMRAIASEAGVSVGNAYYYFESKEFRSTSSNDFASSRIGSVGERGRRDA